MTYAQRTIALVGLLLVGTALVGVVVRSRYRVWLSFATYLAVVLVATALPYFLPATFHTPDFWQVKETAYAGLRFAMAVELAARTFAAFPAARSTVRGVAFTLLGAVFMIVVAAPVSGGGYMTFIGELQPRVLMGTIWLFTAIAALVLWYRLPLHPFHKMILLSYVPYLLLFTVYTRVLPRSGWTPLLGYGRQLAYVALLVFWNVAIWRREPAPRDAAASAPLRDAASTSLDI